MNASSDRLPNVVHTKNKHKLVETSGGGDTFVTGLLGKCDLAAQRITLLSAGHSWPSICSHSEMIACEASAASLPWGVFLERSPEPQTFDLSPDDWSVVAYTDGVADNVLADGGAYGADRLVELHHRHRQSSADEICEEILTDVLSSSDASKPQQDDITLLVLRSATMPGVESTHRVRRSTRV